MSHLASKRVLIITPAIEQRVSKIVWTLAQLGYDIRIITGIESNRFDNLLEKIPRTNYKYLLNPQFTMDPLLISSLKRLVDKLIADFKPEIVIFREIMLFGVLRNNLKKFMKVNTILVDIADNYEYVASDLYNKFNPVGWWLKASVKSYLKELKRVKYVTVVCQQNADRISKNYELDRSKFHVLENLPLKAFASSCHSKSIKKPKSIVYSGQIDNRIRDLFEVVDAVHRTDWTIYIYATNHDSKDFRRLANYVANSGASDKVKFEGPVAFSESIDVLKSYSLGIIPHKNIDTVKYTLPNKLYDYIHAKIPILVKDVPVLTEYVNSLHVGLSYKSSADLQKKLQSLSIDDYLDFEESLYKARSTLFWEDVAESLFERLFRK